MKNSITVKAPINIALVKYWGKADEKNVLPYNSSVSVTLDMDVIYTITTISFEHTSSVDRVFLNGTEIELSARIKRLVDDMDRYYCQKHNLVRSDRPPILVRSENVNFPTAAGLASSASGMAALTFGLYKLFGLEDIIPERTLTTLARRASGSACRSIPSGGGFVEWHAAKTDEASFAETIPFSDDFANLVILVYVFSQKQKTVSSTDGMRRTAATSSLFRHRVQSQVNERLVSIKRSIASGAWAGLFKLIMIDSNSFHACCLDTYPPICYLSDSSHSIIKLVTEFNLSEIKAAYSFDAGPNAFVFLHQKNLSDWLAFSQETTKNAMLIKTKLGTQGACLLDQ